MEVEIPDPESSGEELQRTARLFCWGKSAGKKDCPKKFRLF
jgi:hypothetical protein